MCVCGEIHPAHERSECGGVSEIILRKPPTQGTGHNQLGAPAAYASREGGVLLADAGAFRHPKVTARS